MGGMGVKQANPEIARDVVEVAQECAEGGGVARKRFDSGVEFFGSGNRTGPFRTKIESVVSGVLGDEIDFFDSFVDELLYLLNEVGLSTAAMRPAHSRNDAETAGMIATFRNLDVSEMIRSETETRGSVIGDVDGTLGDI